MPVKIAITPGQTHNIWAGAELLADKAYDTDWLRAMVSDRGGWANIPPKYNRKSPVCYRL